MAEEKQPKFDVDGYSAVNKAIMAVLADYPAGTIRFSQLDDDFGIAMFPTSGALVAEERNSVTGKCFQRCRYPFSVVYRASGLSSSQKQNAQEWLDKLGRWLEKQPVEIGDATEILVDYPALTGDREFTVIARATPAYLESINTNNSENWVISLYAEYTNIFWRNAPWQN